MVTGKKLKATGRECTSMSPSGCRYHTTRFVLDALGHAARHPDATERAFWVAWLRGVSLMFEWRELPRGLRAGMAKAAHGTPLLQLVLDLDPPRRQADENQRWLDRWLDWVKRRDEGNERAARARREGLERCAVRKREEAAQKQKEREEAMQPVWDARVKAVQRERDELLASATTGRSRPTPAGAA